MFTCLSANPEICGSSVKETCFFTHEYKGDAERDIACYKKYFSLKNNEKIMLEASPNYLGSKVNITTRIKQLLPQVKLLFILRNPVDRLYSYYNFAMAKLQLPADLSFESYVDLCKKYSVGEFTPAQAGIAEKHLRALDMGIYHRQLQNYLDVFPRQQIKIMFFDELKNNQQTFMNEICDFIGISQDFYRDYTFHKSNVTFSGRVKFIHRIAMLINRFFETVLRKYPKIKQRLVRFYKGVNQRNEGYSKMDKVTRDKLLDYYAEGNLKLKDLLSNQNLPKWVDIN